MTLSVEPPVMPPAPSIPAGMTAAQRAAFLRRWRNTLKKWEEAHQKIIEGLLKRICLGATIDANGNVTVTGSRNTGASCVCLKAIIDSGKKVKIRPVHPDYELDGYPMSHYGGGAVKSGAAGVKNADGTPGAGAPSNVYIDITNNNGQGYANGSSPWLVLANLLASGTAYKYLTGVAARDPKERYSEAISTENKIYRGDDYVKRDPEEEQGDIPEDDEEVLGGFLDPYKWSIPSEEEESEEEGEGSEGEGGTEEEGGTDGEGSGSSGGTLVEPMGSTNSGCLPFGWLIGQLARLIGQQDQNCDGDGDDDNDEDGTGGGTTTGEEEDGDDPRDTPPATIYGEEIDNTDLPLLIFVPGIMGSQLEDKDGSTLWDSVIAGVPLTSVENMYPGKSVKAKFVGDQKLNQTGKTFGNIYDDLLEYFADKGYQLGLNFWIYGYNWTESNDTSGAGLLAFIEQKIQEFALRYNVWHESVNIVNHSMGGLVTRAAMKFGARIKDVAFIASPHRGSAEAYMQLHPGIDTSVSGFGQMTDNFLLVGWGSILVDAIVGFDKDGYKSPLKHFMSKLDSVYELLPENNFLNWQHVLTFHDLDQYGVTHQIRPTSMTWLCHAPFTLPPGPGLAQLNYPAEAKPKVERASAFKKSIETYPGGHKYFNNYWASKSTKSKVDFHEIDATTAIFTTASEDNGDGTVNGISANPREHGQPWTNKGDVEGGHNDLPNDSAVLDAVSTHFGI